MTKQDRIIADLIDALGIIITEARKDNASRHYILGAAEMAIELANAQRERNTDGYLVVKE